MFHFFPKPKELLLRRSAISLLIIMWTILIMSAFFYTPTAIVPSGSLMPTMLVGDVCVLDKTAYGYSKWNIPFQLNLFDGKIFDRMPKRGDLVAFISPEEDKITYFKRVIGLPGDSIQFKEGKLYINGESCTYEKLEDFDYKDQDSKWKKVGHYIERFPNGFEHKIIRVDDSDFDLLNNPNHNTQEIYVPENHILFIGDNRSRSHDGRKFGVVHKDKIVGKVIFVSMSFYWGYEGAINKVTDTPYDYVLTFLNPVNWKDIKFKPRLKRFGHIPK